MLMLLVYLMLALGVSFLCSLLEASLLSIPSTHVEVLVQRGHRAGPVLKRMKQNVDRPLAAILTLNTIAHTVGAAGVGAEATKLLGDQWFGLVGVVLTLLILILSEIIPKTVGAVYARGLAPFAATAIRAMIWLTLPLVWVCETVSSLFGQADAGPSFSRQEVAALATLGGREGVLTASESHVIDNLLRLRKVRVKDIMTPRPVVFALPATMNVGQVLRGEPPRFARVPVYNEGAENWTGVVHWYQLLKAASDGRENVPLSELVSPIHAVPELSSVADVLEQFLARNEQCFQVVDEFGGTAGLVTLEDAFETLHGVEIVDETDSVTDMQQMARQVAERRRHGEG